MVNLSEIITKRTKLVVLAHVSNVLGTINPIREIAKEVKRLNPRCLVLVDGAQAVPHMKVDVKALECDFYAFSGHKMFGPTGVGVLWGKRSLFSEMAPVMFGGSMIDEVTLQATTFKAAPMKFEAGTPPIAGVIGLGAAVDYINSIGIDKITAYEQELTEYALEKLNQIDNVEILGAKEKENRTGVISFVYKTEEGKTVHPHDIADILARSNVCVRAGHHCAMLLHARFKVAGSVRVSLHLYNTREDIDALVEGIGSVNKIFK